MVKVGLIGCGAWGRNHARVLSEFGVLHAVADAEKDRSTGLATALGCVALDADELLRDPDIGAVVFALDPLGHGQMALAALAAGKHVLVEKPMALDIATATAIVAAAHRAGKVAMTGHIMRFHPGFLALQTLVANGELGEIRHIATSRAGFGKFFPGVDVLWDLAPHDLSLLMALTGALPSRASVEAAPVLTEAADIAWLHLEFPGGAVADCALSRVAPEKQRLLTVTGTHATAVFDDLAPWHEKLVVHHHPEGADGHVGVAVPIPVAEAPPLDAELRHFLDCIATGAAPISGVDEGLEVIRVLDGLRSVDTATAPATRPEATLHLAWSRAS